MRSRLAITIILAIGILISTAGAGLAVSGLALNGDATSAQYGETLGRGQPTQVVVQPTRQVGVLHTSTNLPATGYAAIPILLAGLVLAGAGVALRRRAQHASHIT